MYMRTGIYGQESYPFFVSATVARRKRKWISSRFVGCVRTRLKIERVSCLWQTNTWGVKSGLYVCVCHECSNDDDDGSICLASCTTPDRRRSVCKSVCCGPFLIDVVDQPRFLPFTIEFPLWLGPYHFPSFRLHSLVIFCQQELSKVTRDWLQTNGV